MNPLNHVEFSTWLDFGQRSLRGHPAKLRKNQFKGTLLPLAIECLHSFDIWNRLFSELKWAKSCSTNFPLQQFKTFVFFGDVKDKKQRHDRQGYSVTKPFPIGKDL